MGIFIAACALLCASADCTKAPQGDQYLQEPDGTNETSASAQTHRSDAAIANPSRSGSAGHRR